MSSPGPRALPRVAAVDASFVINVHRGVEAAEKALTALRHAKAELVVPSPVWAEIGRGPGGLARFAAIGTATIPFNARAASLIASHLGKKAKDTRCGRFVWDYDAQIYVCAVAAGADAIVTDNVDDFDSIARAASPSFQGKLELWSSAQLARHAPPVQLSLPRADR